MKSDKESIISACLCVCVASQTSSLSKNQWDVTVYSVKSKSTLCKADKCTVEKNGNSIWHFARVVYLCTLLLNVFVFFGLDPLCDVLCEHQAQTCRLTCKKTTVQTVCTHTASSAKRGKVTSITDWLVGSHPQNSALFFLCSLLSTNNISQT